MATVSLVFALSALALAFLASVAAANSYEEGKYE